MIELICYSLIVFLGGLFWISVIMLFVVKIKDEDELSIVIPLWFILILFIVALVHFW